MDSTLFLNPADFELPHDYDENAEANLIEIPADFGLSHDDDDETDDEEEDDDDDEDEEYVPAGAPPRVSHDAPRVSTSNSEVVTLIESQNKRRRTEGGEASCSFANGSLSQENEWASPDVDGLLCPICMDAWTNNGEHHICCLPCGHIYGMSCIKKWLQHRRNSNKCPQCKVKCSLKDVRKLYASQVVAVEEENQKRIRSLEAKCAALESKVSNWHKKETGWQKREAALSFQVQKLTEGSDCHKKEAGWQKKEAALNLQVQKLTERNTYLEMLLDMQNRQLMFNFELQMSLMSPFEMQDILLPSGTNGVKDLHISASHSSSSLALFASLGKKLSVLSLDSGNLVVNYDLQNGSVLVFDMRQTAGPMKSLVGLTSNPVHTVHALAQTSSLSSGVKTILSASAVGLCQWNLDSEERPLMVPETDNQGVCISLAYCPSSDDIVASYRPKYDMSMDLRHSQPSPTPPRTQHGVQGTHVLFNRMGSHHFQKVGSSYASVSKFLLPKCVIMDIEDQSRLFASLNEDTRDLVLHALPSFSVLQQLKMQAQGRDLRYSPSHGILGCLSENTLQLFSKRSW
ncbi:E3 ubiquitin-protein ligase RFWD3 isoform E [Glycine soja]|uniref:E3 ubiquitin-protein ligase RFWD3 isoform E n=1 Tax=Glycine soja TaxID=3848 RepID=A0A445LDH3_GLYSO|nr:E3 ubiquitin-protein ligase RFWD3 isoform E [Glycine soja]